ncbi:G-type lectin S-receptor-like serine/threonine-protein kinase LECRK1 [Thalictrum thalictroides]|uniref:G-type lectin S-receptor-like serine/threonine-protein kinase LECRK1 n=1 Tax=Thalictrum thalictroides TaxID=46969 RepID=A0A7J6V2Q4_THATH|nr:G-type lectin S-receptor-like serine/threonine-protein kinase LECRK1 [Thalictrum thalictroides]
MIINSRAFFLFVFSLLLLSIVESSTLFNSNTTTNSSSIPFNNITIGSTIVASSSSSNSNQSVNSSSRYWLSPSGIFAFGFHPLCSCDDDDGQYKVAIWINKPSSSSSPRNRIVVWSLRLANNEEAVYYSGSSILLSQNGLFIIQPQQQQDPNSTSITNTVKPLFNHILGTAASYGLMKDDGNFVVYNSELNIMWQSFDHPTDTILPGQTLKPGKSLVVNDRYELIMQKNGNLEIIDDYLVEWKIRWESKTRSKENCGTVLNLDTTGRMYLDNQFDGIVIKNLTRGESRRINDTTISMIYRAKLESNGVLRLYVESIKKKLSDTDTDDESSGKSIQVWHSRCMVCKKSNLVPFIGLGILPLFALVVALICWLSNWLRNLSRVYGCC